MYKEVCFAHLMLGGCGGMLPSEISLLVHFQGFRDWVLSAGY